MAGEAYAVAAEFTLKDNVTTVLRGIVSGLDIARRGVKDLQAEFDALGKASGPISRLVRSLTDLQTVSFPSGLTSGAAALEGSLSAAVGRMDDLLKKAKETGIALDSMKGPSPARGPSSGGSGGRHGGGDPVMEGLAGAGVLDFYAGNYEKYASVEQVYRGMQADQRLAGASPAMQAIRDQAGGQMQRYRTLTPLDVARNSGEAFTIGGGDMSEQPAIADMLDRLEQNLILRGKSPEDAQRQATAIVRGLDVSNQFFNRKSGQFDLKTANAAADRVQALVAASNGLMTGQQFLAFEKSAGQAGQNLSLEGEARMSHLIDINPSRSGTALRSFENLFGGHGSRMTKKDKAWWTAHGLYDKKSGLLVDDDLRKSDPLAWMEKHLSGFSNTDIDDHTQRMNVSSLVAEVKGSQGNINRQSAAVARSDMNANSANMLNSPQGAVLQFEASLEHFRTSLGKFESGPGIKLLDMLSNGLDRLTKAMSNHPEATENLLKLSAALALFAVARGAASLLGLSAGVSALTGSLTGFGGPGTAALRVLTAGAGTAGSLPALAAALGLVGVAVLALWGISKIGPNNPHPNTNARGMGYSGRDHVLAGTDIPAPHGWGALDGLGDTLWKGWKDSQHPQSRGNAKGLGAAHYDPTSYVGDGGGMQPIHIALHLDGRVIAENTTHHMIRNMRPAVHGGSNNADYLAHPMPAGMRTI